MAWPITLNGNTYTEADIVGPNYDRVLGQFLFDLSAQITSTKMPVAESNSTISPGTGTRNFTLSKGSGNAFSVGTPLTAVGYTTNGLPKYMLTGWVESASGAALRTTIEHQFQFPNSEAGPAIRWELVSGTWAVTPAGEAPMELPPEQELVIMEDFDVPYSHALQRDAWDSPDPYPVGIYSTDNYVLNPQQEFDTPGRPGIVSLSPGEAGAAAILMDRVDVRFDAPGTVRFGFRVRGSGSGHLSVGLRGRVPAVDDGTPANLLQALGPPHGPGLRTRIQPEGVTGSWRNNSVFAVQYQGTEPGDYLFSNGDWVTLTIDAAGFPEYLAYARLHNHSSGTEVQVPLQGPNWPSGMARYVVPYLTLWRNTGDPLHLDVDYIEVRQPRTLGAGFGGGGSDKS